MSAYESGEFPLRVEIGHAVKIHKGVGIACVVCRLVFAEQAKGGVAADFATAAVTACSTGISGLDV